MNDKQTFDLVVEHGIPKISTDRAEQAISYRSRLNSLESIATILPPSHHRSPEETVKEPKIIVGEYIAKSGKLAVGCSAAVFDNSHQRILLIRRMDNGLWAVPGGYMQAGESLTEACAREVFEETGLHVKVKRLISVYTNPHRLLEYPDGNRLQLVVLHFEAQPVSGDVIMSDESSEVKFFSQAEVRNLAVGRFDHMRVMDAFADQETTFIRDEF